MEQKKYLKSQKDIENRIFTIRGLQVMLDSHLAEMYNVENKRLNEQVKRNSERFPDSYWFQLTENEWKNLRSQLATLEMKTLRSQYVTLNKGRGQHRKYLPYVFTEQGVAMLSAVLHSETAVKVSIQIINAFVEMRKLVAENAGLFQRIDKIEFKQILADRKIEHIFKALENKYPKSDKGIFFSGQIFDAYSFVIKLIEKANKELLIIDNYADNSVLDMLSKKKNNVKVTLIVQTQAKLKVHDVQKFNQQYPFLILKHTQNMHDRFLLIDGAELYHIGSSLKDLGKKCFAFSLIVDKEIIRNLLRNL